MQSISSLVEKVLKKHNTLPKLKEDISTNLEFRLLFTIDFSKPFKEAKKDFLKNYLSDLLTLSLGNISAAAKKAQLHRRHFHRIIHTLDIDANTYRKELLKPSQYMKENIYMILEETLLALESDSKLREVYSNLEDISQVIAKNLDNITYEEALELFEKEFIKRALKSNDFNIQKTADSMEMSERTLYRKINRLNIAVA